MTILFFIAGLILLIVGAELLVKGASRLASLLRISPLVIGLTVVAFGTSAPELAVSIKASLSGQASITMGNVIGSNTFNVLFILGVSALIAPLVVSKQLIRMDVPLMVAISLLVFVLALDGNISRGDGALLFATLIIYIVFLIVQSRKEAGNGNDEFAREYGPTASGWPLNVGLVIAGFVLLLLGSRWLVDSAVSFAQQMGVSELLIALTIIAAGTSLPEVVTSVVASLRGERDIAVGNVVGSNLFNLMGVLGISSIISPAGIEISESIIRFDLPVMITVAFACLPIFFSGGVISRWEGALLLGYYVIYTVYLVLAAIDYTHLPTFGTMLLYVVIPLTMVTLLVITFRSRNTATP